MTLAVLRYAMYALLVTLDVFGCYVGPLVTLAMFAMLCWPFGDHCHVWLCYYGPLVTLAVFGYVM